MSVKRWSTFRYLLHECSLHQMLHPLCMEVVWLYGMMLDVFFLHAVSPPPTLKRQLELDVIHECLRHKILFFCVREKIKGKLKMKKIMEGFSDKIRSKTI